MRDVIEQFVKVIKPERYLEIGLGDGRNFNSVPAKEKVCISPFGVVKKPHKIYNGLSEKVFKNFKEKPFDIIFIDGFHRYENVMNDIYNSLNFLNDNGIIIIHDVNPLDKHDSFSSRKIPENKKRRRFGYCGDVYKSVLHVKYFMLEVNFVTIKRFAGWMIIWKLKKERSLNKDFNKIKKIIDFNNDYPFIKMNIRHARKNRKLFEFGTTKEAIRKYKKRKI